MERIARLRLARDRVGTRTGSAVRRDRKGDRLRTAWYRYRRENAGIDCLPFEQWIEHLRSIGCLCRECGGLAPGKYRGICEGCARRKRADGPQDKELRESFLCDRETEL